MQNENDRIKEVRQCLGLTLEKFGQNLGVTKVAISNIENGHRNVTSQMRKAICREYGINEAWMKNGVGDMFVKNHSRKEVRPMITIRGTAAEFMVMKQVLSYSSDYCPFPRSDHVACDHNCPKCVEKNITWECTDEHTDSRQMTAEDALAILGKEIACREPGDYGHCDGECYECPYFNKDGDLVEAVHKAVRVAKEKLGILDIGKEGVEK